MKYQTVIMTFLSKPDLKPYHPMFGKPWKSRPVAVFLDENGIKKQGGVYSSMQEVFEIFQKNS